MCKETGRLTRTTSDGRGGKIHSLVCQNDRCKWFDTGWLVQVLANGEVAERTKGDSEFPPLSAFAELRAAGYVAAINREVTRTTSKRPTDK
jgi:hypothetical protein